MVERTTGIVLRTRPLTESSMIVHWLTAEAGRVSTVARGARRPKSTFRGKLDLFFEADLAFNRSRRSDLHTLQEVVLRESFPALRMDYPRLRQAAYAVAVIEQTTETDTPLPEVWEWFRDLIRHLNANPVLPETVPALELRHLACLGLAPDLRRASLPDASRRLAEDLLNGPWPTGEPSPCEVIDPLIRFLHGFLIHHLGRLPRGRAEALMPVPRRTA